MNKSFLNGIKMTIPPCLGVIPIGMSVGLLGCQAGMTVFETILMSAMVMAGSSQLLVIGMMGQAATMSAMVIGTFFINLRHIVMSSSVMQHFKKIPLPKRLLGAFALCDESFAIFSMSEDHSFPFFLGSNTALYASFVGSTALGGLITNFLPQIVINSFGIAFYAAFIGLLIPNIKKNMKLTALVLITALLNWVFQLFIPSSWAVIASMILGAFFGVTFIDDEEEEEADEL